MGCAPAPRAPGCGNANVDFAMGIEGTQIAKDAASIILLDDNFTCIVVVAKWRRNVFDSMQKFLQFQLTVSASSLVLNVICVCIDALCPLTGLRLLWLNLILDSVLANGCPGLNSLDLSVTAISDIGVQPLASSCPGLTTLNLDSGSKITDVGLQALATAALDLLHGPS